MLKNFFKLSLVSVIALSSCNKDEGNPPSITFDSEGITGVYAGDNVPITGKVTADNTISSVVWFHQKQNTGGNMEEVTGGSLTLGANGSFSFTLTVAENTVGVKVVAKDDKDKSSEKVLSVVLGEYQGAPEISFDKEKISVKPDSVFIVSGQVASGKPVSSLSYVVYVGTTAEAAQTTSLSNNRFSINLTANKNITSVKVVAKDELNNESDETVPVEVLYPSRTEGNVMIHYKNLIFDDKRTFDKSYFSFDVAPYVLNAAQAKANQNKVHLMYTNVFNSAGHAQNGAALFSPNVYLASTVNAHALVADWTLSSIDDYPLARLSSLPAGPPYGWGPALENSTGGKKFDEIGDSSDDWTAINTWLSSVAPGSNGVFRPGAEERIVPGTVFIILYGGIHSAGVDGINKYAVGIVRGKGGTPATEANQSTKSWLEIEIKMKK